MDSKKSVLPHAEGQVEEALPGLSFRVRLPDGRIVLAHLSGKMRMYHIRIVPGDKVLMELSPDGERGRITRRM